MHKGAIPSRRWQVAESKGERDERWPGEAAGRRSSQTAAAMSALSRDAASWGDCAEELASWARQKLPIWACGLR